ncbi:hypothetical protein DNJ72_06760 [Prochlorococcus marinus XMU1403]|nr:hypothetical protein [Prochlorococcus marinus str. MU1403]PYE00760.1 hypothetical protein DNJ72_06760 [Prochlorococcus marinus XMU1403]
MNLLTYKKEKLKNSPSIEEIVSVTLSCTLIRMTEINKIDRSVLYQEFKEWILNSGENEESQEILCLRYLKNDRKTN